MTKKGAQLGIKIGVSLLIVFSLGVAFLYLRNNSAHAFQDFMNQIGQEAENNVGKVAYLDKQVEGKEVIAYFPTGVEKHISESLEAPLKYYLEKDTAQADVTVYASDKPQTLNGYTGYPLTKKKYNFSNGQYQLSSTELYQTRYFTQTGEAVSFQKLLEDQLDSAVVVEKLKALVSASEQPNQIKSKIISALESKGLAQLNFAYTSDCFGIETEDSSGLPILVKLNIQTIIPHFKEQVVFDSYKNSYNEQIAAVRAQREANRKQNLETVVNKIAQKVPTKKIALTFDDGPSDITTPQVLDILAKHNVKATFYLLGSRVAGNESIIKRMVASGHELGNHSWDHPDLTTLSPEEVKNQVERAKEAIEKASGGVSPKSFRPPYGAVNQQVSQIIKSPIAMWNVDSFDWKSRSADETFQMVSSHISGGSVVLMHDIHQSTVDSLDRMIGYLKEQGYELVPFSELYNSDELLGGVLYFGDNDAKIVSQ